MWHRWTWAIQDKKKRAKYTQKHAWNIHREQKLFTARLQLSLSASLDSNWGLGCFRGKQKRQNTLVNHITTDTQSTMDKIHWFLVYIIFLYFMPKFKTSSHALTNFACHIMEHFLLIKKVLHFSSFYYKQLQAVYHNFFPSHWLMFFVLTKSSTEELETEKRRKRWKTVNQSSTSPQKKKGRPEDLWSMTSLAFSHFPSFLNTT